MGILQNVGISQNVGITFCVYFKNIRMYKCAGVLMHVIYPAYTASRLCLMYFKLVFPYFKKKKLLKIYIPKGVMCSR